MARRRALGVGAQDLDVSSRGDVLCGARVVHRERAVEFLGIDDHVGVGQLAELQKLRIREGGLGWAAATDDHDLRDAARGQDVERMVRGVGRRELRRREHEHPRDVDRDVAVADHDGALGRAEVDLEVGVVGMAVVPADELGRRVGARQVFAGDSERPVQGRAGRVDDRVVVGQKLLARDVLAEDDVAEEAKARV